MTARKDPPETGQVARSARRKRPAWQVLADGERKSEAAVRQAERDGQRAQAAKARAAREKARKAEAD